MEEGESHPCGPSQPLLPAPITGGLRAAPHPPSRSLRDLSTHPRAPPGAGPQKADIHPQTLSRRGGKSALSRQLPSAPSTVLPPGPRAHVSCSCCCCRSTEALPPWSRFPVVALTFHGSGFRFRHFHSFCQKALFHYKSNTLLLENLENTEENNTGENKVPRFFCLLLEILTILRWGLSIKKEQGARLVWLSG